MRKWIWLVFFILFSCYMNAFAAGNAVLLNINGSIGPGVQDYIVRNITKANATQAKLIIIELNTPGGLETSMRGINEAIIASSVPVVAYVTPSGARAASAGLYIMYASHFAAMAPGTNLGAATPVNISQDKNDNDTHAKKAASDAAAYLRSLAQLRGRNDTWAESAVTKSASLSATEAKKMNVITNIANDVPQLLTQLNGKTTLLKNIMSKVDTSQLSIETIKPDWRSQFLAFITDPNIAYMLLLVAMYGLFFELSNPGLVLPGVAGIIALLMALYAFQLLPVNYAGLALIFVGVCFMIFEVSVSSFGVVGVGGIIAFVVGSIMLFETTNPYFQVAYSLIAAMSLTTALFILLAMTLMIRAHRKPVVTGHAGLIGKEGIVMSCHADYVIIQLMGEIWKAKAHDILRPGQTIKVVKTDGLLLTIKPMNKEYQ